MSIEEALYARLSGAAAITELTSTRIYPYKLPQNPIMPAITYQRVSTSRYHTHDTSGASGLARPRFQFDCYASSYLGAKQLVEALRGVLEGFNGYVGAQRIQGALSQNETDFYEDVTGLYRRSIDFMIHHQE